MGQDTKIEWTGSVRADGTLASGHTGNLWIGCTKVHEGCDNCYAESLSHRWGNDVWGIDKSRKAVKSVWSNFLTWQAHAAAAGEKHRVFVGSMMDIFEKSMPMIDHKGNEMNIWTGALRDRFLNEIIPACPDLDFLLLTKRPSNINKFIPDSWLENPPPNVMFGTSVSNQSTFDTLVPHLKKVKGRLFLSIEPQIGPIQATPEDLDGFAWIIQGGESGHGKRPFQLAWASSMAKACADAGVPYFFKQIDKVRPIPPDMMIRQFPPFVSRKTA